MTSQSLTYFRIIAALEGISLLCLLFIAMPIKYIGGEPYPVRVVGMAHGLLFIAYVALLFLVAAHQNWKWHKTMIGLIASSVPFATFWFDRRLAIEHINRVSTRR